MLLSVCALCICGCMCVLCVNACLCVCSDVYVHIHMQCVGACMHVCTCLCVPVCKQTESQSKTKRITKHNQVSDNVRVKQKWSSGGSERFLRAVLLS